MTMQCMCQKSLSEKEAPYTIKRPFRECFLSAFSVLFFFPMFLLFEYKGQKDPGGQT